MCTTKWLTHRIKIPFFDKISDSLDPSHKSSNKKNEKLIIRTCADMNISLSPLAHVVVVVLSILTIYLLLLGTTVYMWLPQCQFDNLS